LIVAGAGAKKKIVRKYGKTGLVEFKGRVSDDEALLLYSSAKALLFPGIEDFGIIPVEANAAGCPVIAYRDGGVLDSVFENVTGFFFNEQTPEALVAAMDYFEQNEVTFNNRQLFNDHVQKFSKTAFSENIQNILKERKR
jgi:glycosyltransferase involved in cell wall biosynthesis